MTVKMPELVRHWGVDSLAECLDGVGPELTKKLWSYVPTEGDGPKGVEVWDQLTFEQQQELADAVYEEFPEDKEEETR